MSSEKIVCSLSSYILTNLPDFDRLLRTVCCSRLPTTRNNSGLSLIVPDSEMVKKYLSVTDNIVSDEQLLEIQSFCKKHFLLGLLTDVKEPGKSVEILNLDDKSFKVEKVSDGYKISDDVKNTVVTKSKFRLRSITINNEKLDSKFGIFDQVSSSKGIHLMMGNDNGTRKDKNTKKTTKTGGAIYSRLDLEDFVRMVHADNYNRFFEDYEQKYYPCFYTPYLAVMNSLFLYLRKYNKKLYESLLMVKDPSPEVNFYMFIRPFNRNSSSQLIDDETLSKWGGTMFEYKMNLLDNYFNTEAFGLLKNKNVDTTRDDKNIGIQRYKNFSDSDYGIISKLTGISSNNLKWMDEFRLRYRDNFIALNSGLQTTIQPMTSIIKDISDNFSGTDLIKESIFVRSGKTYEESNKGLLNSISSMFKSKQKNDNSMDSPHNVQVQIYNQLYSKIISHFYDTRLDNEQFHNSTYCYINMCNKDMKGILSIHHTVPLYRDISNDKVGYFEQGIKWVDDFEENNKSVMFGGKKTKSTTDDLDDDKSESENDSDDGKELYDDYNDSNTRNYTSMDDDFDGDGEDLEDESKDGAFGGLSAI